jgi:hypothetical protein
MKEEEIRPKKIFDEYLQYCKEDVEKYFGDEKSFITVSCPSCNSNEIKESFVKNGFTYNLCEKCKTLYVSPLPPEENFREYYTKGKSVKFWVTDFYKHTEKKRRKKIIIPKWNLIKKLINDKSVDTIVDIGAGYGTFCEVVKKDYDNVVAIEPSPIFQKILEKKGITTIQKFMENIDRNDLNGISEGKRLFCSFELWEHLYNPKNFLNAVSQEPHSKLWGMIKENRRALAVFLSALVS